MLTELEAHIELLDSLGLKYNVIDKDWYKVVVEPSYLDSKVVTKFYYTETENRISGKHVFHKYYSNKQGFYFNHNNQKIYFNL